MMSSNTSGLMEDHSFVKTFPAILQKESTTAADSRTHCLRAGLYLDVAFPTIALAVSISANFSVVLFFLAGLQNLHQAQHCLPASAQLLLPRKTNESHTMDVFDID